MLMCCVFVSIFMFLIFYFSSNFLFSMSWHDIFFLVQAMYLLLLGYFISTMFFKIVVSLYLFIVVFVRIFMHSFLLTNFFSTIFMVCIFFSFAFYVLYFF